MRDILIFLLLISGCNQCSTNQKVRYENQKLEREIEHIESALHKLELEIELLNQKNEG
jgi:hypothetical protein